MTQVQILDEAVYVSLCTNALFLQQLVNSRPSSLALVKQPVKKFTPVVLS